MRVHVKARHLLVSVVAASIFALPTYAQQPSSLENAQTTVAETLKKPVDKENVKMQGHLLRQDAFDKYIFSDGTGEIVVHIKSARFPGLSFDAATDIALTGEVGTVANQPPEIEVKSVEVVK